MSVMRCDGCENHFDTDRDVSGVCTPQNGYLCESCAEKRVEQILDELPAEKCTALLDGWNPPDPVDNADQRHVELVRLQQMRAAVRSRWNLGRLDSGDILKVAA